MKKNPWTTSAIIFLIALFLFSINLDRPPNPDELHHVLAAQNLIETGQPLIGEGEYRRGILHTWMVAISYKVFGEGIASARIPAVLLVALIAPILFFWVRREAGYLAAWLTAGLFISSPFTVEIAQFSRFYAIQIFSFVLGVLFYYYALTSAEPLWRRFLMGALATVLLYLAFWAQVTTLFGLVGVAVWTVGLTLHRIYFSAESSLTIKKFSTTGLVVLSVIVLLIVTLTDTLQPVLERYRSTQLFNVEHQNEFWFYYLRFFLFYPTLWTLVGVIAVFAVIRSNRLAWLAICIFGVGFLLMSFAGTKATRYISFAPPFLAVLWGIGLATIIPQLLRYGRESRVRLVETFALPPRLGTIAGNLVLVGALAVLVLSNPFWLRSAAMIGNVALPGEVPTTNWRVARDALAPWISEADIVITTEELGAIYFLGRSDIRFSPSKLRELAPNQRKEFGIDHRTGRPVISEAESVERLIECFPSGLMVGPIEHWGDPILINKEIKELVTSHAKPIDVPDKSYLYAWSWKRELGDSKIDSCPELQRFSGRNVKEPTE